MLGPCPSPASHLGGKNTQPTIFQPNLQPIPPNVQTSEPRLSGLGGVRLLRRLPSSQEDSTTRGTCSTRGRSHCRHLPCDPQPQHHGPPTGTPARLSSDGWTPLQQQATPAATKPEQLTAHCCQPRHQGSPEQLTAQRRHCGPPFSRQRCQRHPSWYASLASTMRCWRHPSSPAGGNKHPCTFSCQRCQ